MQVTAKSNIKFEGEVHPKGTVLEVPETEAKKLLAAGVIEPVKGLTPEEPEEANPGEGAGSAADKQAENEETQRVAGLPVDKKMKKEKLRGIALAMGLEVDKTLTGPEIFDMINEKRGTTETTPGGASETDEDPTGAEANQSPEGVAASKEVAAEEGLAPTGGPSPVPANPAESAPDQNTKDTLKEPVAPAKPSKSK